jgi:hypothetical protein
MSSVAPSYRLPWQLRLAALVAASLLALSLIVFYIAGVKFVRLVTKVSSQIVQSETVPTASDKPATQEQEEGVVSVRIVPQKTEAP